MLALDWSVDVEQVKGMLREEVHEIPEVYIE